jgi:enoyl-[acyl-carrier-protein] reductase (NADH)
MNTLKKYFLLAALALLPLGVSGCLDDEEPLYDVVGPVATIPVFTSSKTAPTAGETVNLSMRYYSPNAAVKELRLNETIGTGPKRTVASKEVTDFDTRNSYVDTFAYTVPDGTPATTRIVLEVEAVTENDLSGARTLTLTVAP